MKSQIVKGVVRKGVAWPAAMADGAKASEAATVVLDHADGGTALHAEFAKNLFQATVVKVFLGQEAISDFPAQMSADAKNYWASH